MTVSGYSKRQLESLISDIESDYVERKSAISKSALKKCRETICAFANDLPNRNKAGVIFFGVNDDGSFAASTFTDEEMKALSNIKGEGDILPMPTMTIEKVEISGHEIVVATIMPSQYPPVRYKGRVYVRNGPSNSLATLDDERLLNEKRRSKDLSFDLHPVSQATVNDLNRLQFEQDYLTRAFSLDVLENNNRSYIQKLASCRMVDSEESAIPTVAGVLTLADSPTDYIPGGYVQFLRIDGKEYGSPIMDQAEITGTILDLIHTTETVFKAHIFESVDFTSADVEQRTATYPLVALQQFFRNAIMHRSYENTNSPVRVYWFSDRIEIYSPGGPFGSVTTANFGNPGVTDYRNPVLAEIMKVYGYVQRYGFGIAQAQNALRENGHPPAEFSVEKSAVAVVIRKANDS